MMKKVGILLLIGIAILLVKDRPRSVPGFLHIQQVRVSRFVRSSLYGLQASLFRSSADVYLEGISFHRQEHSLSCEVASLKMALGYYGVNISEKELLAKLAVNDPGPRHGGNIWGDPEKGFVGNVDGAMPNSGYGVYEQPIAQVASQYRSARALKDASLSDILNALSDKHPVIVWVSLAGSRDISWTTPEGEKVPAVYGEHARVLTGFSGTIDEPRELFFIDPVYGAVHVPKEEFLANWRILENRAVIVE